MSTATMKEIAWIAAIALLAVAVVARTPLAGYIDGSKKVAGVV
jgi:hypothetical protein